MDEAFDGLTSTWRLYAQQFGRNSIDDNGMDLIGNVHYRRNWGNAQWNGSQMLFGDGIPNRMNRLTTPVDIPGHELTHGVTAHTAGLVYSGQAGALNESISDVFGSLVKQFAANQDAGAADWLIGAGIWAPGINGRALRDMANPGTAFDDPLIGKDDQPAHMSDYVEGGDVHTNSGIPNHAFFLFATKLGGHAWERAGRIWYETLRDPRLHNDAEFVDFAKLTFDNAGRLFGFDSVESRAVAEAWSEVGIAARPWGQGVIAHLSGVVSVAGYFGGDDFHHVIAATSNGDIHELYWQSGTPGQGVIANLPGVVSVAGYFGGDDFHHVIAATSDGNIHELYWQSGTPGQGVIANLSGVVSVAGYFGGDNFHHVIAAAGQGDIDQYVWQSGAPNPVREPMDKLPGVVGVAGYFGGDDFHHVIVATNDGNIHELYRN